VFIVVRGGEIIGWTDKEVQCPPTYNLVDVPKFDTFRPVWIADWYVGHGTKVFEIMGHVQEVVVIRSSKNHIRVEGPTASEVEAKIASLLRHKRKT